ncbi:MAG: hypothetical protein M1823_005647 [Watsoniomyces obsoletus]|nr:MAG: hypothetical protein M1823_005647 [Watsoniomyces obsoletus]
MSLNIWEFYLGAIETIETATWTADRSFSFIYWRRESVGGRRSGTSRAPATQLTRTTDGRRASQQPPRATPSVARDLSQPPRPATGGEQRASGCYTPKSIETRRTRRPNQDRGQTTETIDTQQTGWMTSQDPRWKHRSPAVTSSSTDNETPYPRQQGVTDVLERQTRDDRRAVHEGTMSRDQTPSSGPVYTPQESAALFGQLPAAPSLVQRFTGDGHGETDPETFLEDVEVLALSLRPADEEQTEKALRTQFRWHLAGPAATWLRELPAEKKQT